MKNIFKKIIEEASNGAIFIDNTSWPISFNTIIYENGKIKKSYFNENNIATLVIQNEEEFIKLVRIYIEKEMKLNRKTANFLDNTEENRMKLLISYLFVNATIMDFENPIPYLKRRISFLDNKLMDKEYNVSLGKIFSPKIEEDIYLKIENITQDVRMETPYRIELKLVTKENIQVLKLPTISYGLTEENGITTCYIYSILNKEEKPKDEEEERLRKKASRALYKLNEFVTDDDIKDVSMSSILSLSIFISLLKQKNISNMNIILYLPLRYYSRELAASQIENEARRKSLWERNEKIQTNLTEKMLTTIKRVAYQIEGIEFKNDLLLDNGMIEISLTKEKNQSNNPLLNMVTSKITKK